MADVPFDDPAGRTRFAWARTLLVAFVASLLVERLFFAGSAWSVVILALPVGTIGVLTLARSRPLRHDPGAINWAFPAIVLACVLLICVAAVTGVSSSL